MAKSKILALIFTGLVITLLVLSGPVQGFNLDLTVNKSKPEKGDTITFTAEIQIDSDEQLPVDKIVFELSGPEDIVCTFDKAGNPLDSCEDIKITKIQDPGYGYGYDYNFGYGYGFTPGFLKYKIEVDTRNLDYGTYKSLIRVKVGDEFFSQDGNDIIRVVDDDDPDSACGPEWTCTSWSECSGGVQYRECFRNLNYCALEDKPAEERTCLLEDGNNFLQEESIVLNTFTSETLDAESTMTFNFNSNSGQDNLQFLIIILLMNCIVTTSNIIVKVQENRHLRITKKRLRK